MDKFEPTIPIEDAFSILDDMLAAARFDVETLPTSEAHGRFLAAEQKSLLDLPPFDKSAMDGYAVLADDLRDEYRLVGTTPAGHAPGPELAPGTCMNVMTGAPVPKGAGRVIIVENTKERDNVVNVAKHSRASNICQAGEDVRAGDVILASGARIGPVEIANLIACGITRVPVYRRARVAVISTGDEIVDDPDAIVPGKIMNSNGPMLAALCRESGMEVVSHTSVCDDAELTRRAIAEATECADITILSGGVSVGEFDHVLSAFADIGLRVCFSRVAIQPGKPTVFASAPESGRLVFGLPGNPVSVFVTFHLFVSRAVAILSGSSPSHRQFHLHIAADFKRRRAERRAYVPARLTRNGEAQCVSYHGSAHLAALMRADGFIIVPVGVRELSAGDPVDFVAIPKGFV